MFFFVCFLFFPLFSFCSVLRKNISITGNYNSSNLASDVEIILNTRILSRHLNENEKCIDFSFVIYDDNKTFVTSNHTIIPYWIEGGCNSEHTRIWLDFAALSEEHRIWDSINVYAYYGDENPYQTHAYTFDGIFTMLHHNDSSRSQCPNGRDMMNDENYFNYVLPGDVHKEKVIQLDHNHAFVATSDESNEGLLRICTSYNIFSSSECFGTHHSHVINENTEYSSNKPDYFTVLSCDMKNMLDLNIHDLVFFDNASRINNSAFSVFEDIENFFLKISSKSGEKYSEGHQHTFSDWNLGDAIPESVKKFLESSVFCDEEQDYFVPPGSSGHYHYIGSGKTINEIGTLPPYVDVLIAKANEENKCYPIEGMIVGMSETPPLGWERFDDWDGLYIRGSKNSGNTGGTKSHTHQIILDEESGTASYDTTNYLHTKPNSETKCMSDDHTHTVTVTEEYVKFASNLVSSYSLRLYKRKKSGLMYYITGSEEVAPVPICSPQCEHGDCVENKKALDLSGVCECLPSWNGSSCNQSLCNQSLCVETNGYCLNETHCHCNCNENIITACYFGDHCEHFFCFGENHTLNESCGEHGVCVGPDNCKCSNGYGGLKCSDPTCNGIVSTSEDVCNGKGNCLGVNQCNCSDGYEGEYCDNFTCFGVENSLTNVCSSHGECLETDSCSCLDDNYFGENCELFMCRSVTMYDNDSVAILEWVMNNESHVCSGNGNCKRYDECECDGYDDIYCGTWSCFGKSSLDSKACNGGECVKPDVCECPDNYYGPECNLYNCFNVSFNDSIVCSGNGTCLAPDKCLCTNFREGDNCDDWSCNGNSKFEESTCGNGLCVTRDKCVCDEKWHGSECNIWECFGLLKSSSLSCGLNGTCISMDNCSCDDGYELREDNSGFKTCKSDITLIVLASILGTVGILLLVLFLMIGVLSCIIIFIILKLKKKNKEVIELKEMSSIIVKDGDGSTNIKSLKAISSGEVAVDVEEALRIDPKIIEFGKTINSGSFGVVRKGIMKVGTSEIDVAIKEIPLGSNSSLGDTIHEVKIMVNTKNENILKCFGCWVEKHACFIVMELCKTDLFKFKKKKLPKHIRVNLLYQTAMGVMALHSKGLIHRDLKTQNVLLTDTNVAKVCDFGTSKSVDSVSNTFCGTPEYLAPEQINPSLSKEPQLIDIYSFGIIIWEVWTGEVPYNEIKEKFPSNHFELMNEIHQKDKRPSLEKCEDMPEELKELMVSCWAKDPDERPASFDEIVGILAEIEKDLKKKK